MAVAVVVAAGRGERLGFHRPKALVPVAGRPMVAWSLAVLLGVEDLRTVVVVLPPRERLPPDPADWGLPGGSWDGAGGPRVIAVPGGRERSHSVRAGVEAARTLGTADPDEVVLVHDGARPLVTAELVRACLDAVAAGPDAAIAAAPITDTVKEHELPAGDPPRVARTLDRSLLWAVQTPQVFRAPALLAALAAGDEALGGATDDASLVEAAGGDVRLVAAPRWNLKITLPEDLAVAELLLGAGADAAATVAAR